MVTSMRAVLRATGELLADLPPYVVGLGVLLGISGALGAVAFF